MKDKNWQDDYWRYLVAEEECVVEGIARRYEGDLMSHDPQCCVGCPFWGDEPCPCYTRYDRALIERRMARKLVHARERAQRLRGA